ncbi:MAG: hypothetical protein IJQ45_01255 [Clostridia bacterium]|nr:hypothetical protein [Clostridia bacterium]
MKRFILILAVCLLCLMVFGCRSAEQTAPATAPAATAAPADPAATAAPESTAAATVPDGTETPGPAAAEPSAAMIEPAEAPTAEPATPAPTATPTPTPTATPTPTPKPANGDTGNIQLPPGP